MSAPSPTSEHPVLNEPPDFSLVLGGPLYQLFRRMRLEGDAPQLLRRRVAVLTLVPWLPLLLLSILERHAWGDSVAIPFLYDFEIHIRLLIALPLLVLAELVVNERMRPVVRGFVTRGLIRDASRARFDSAITSAMRLRNSMVAEVLLIAFVYGVGVFYIWRTQLALDTTSWSGTVVDGVLQPSLAGWWLGCVSLPVFQFLLLRWYYRLFIWARFLWQASRIELSLLPTHPDRCGGLGFLSAVIPAFQPVLLAQGALLAGLMANRIFYAGAKLPDFRLEIIGVVGFMVFAVLGPLLSFVPKLSAAKRAGLADFRTLADRYTREFEQKWLRGGAPADEPLLGSADIQSLSDLDNGYDVLKEMKYVPFGMQTVLQLAVITLLPAAPLLLTILPLEELLVQLLKVLF